MTESLELGGQGYDYEVGGGGGSGKAPDQIFI